MTCAQKKKKVFMNSKHCGTIFIKYTFPWNKKSKFFPLILKCLPDHSIPFFKKIMGKLVISINIEVYIQN